MYLRASLGFWKRHTSSCYSPCDVQPNSFLLVLGDNRDYSERWPMSIWKCSADTHGYSGIVAASLTHCGEPSWHTKQRVNSCGGKCCHQDDSQKMLFVSQVDEISEEVWVDHCSYPQADRPQQQFPTVICLAPWFLIGYSSVSFVHSRKPREDKGTVPFSSIEKRHSTASRFVIEKHFRHDYWQITNHWKCSADTWWWWWW